MTTLPHVVTIRIGAESDYGHKVMHDTGYLSNRNQGEIQSSYRQAAREHNLQLLNHCTDYEDSQLPPSFVARLREVFTAANNTKIIALLDSYQNDEIDGLDIDSDAWETLYFAIVRLADPDLILQPHSLPTPLYIGGYGFFWG